MSFSGGSGLFFSLPTLGLPVSQAEFLQLWLSAMQAEYGNSFSPASGDLDYVQAQVFASWAADVAQLCASGATELFRQFGTQLVNYPYQQGDSAVAIIQVTAVDSAGYTLPAQTQLTLTLSGVQVAFQTASTLTIAPSSTTGQVNVYAVQSGSALNGAGAPAALVSQIDWVSSLSVVTNAAGGLDQQSDDQYLVGLANALQLLAPRPITASDFATMATNFIPATGTDQQEVGRATAIDGYDPPIGSTVNGATYTTSAVGGPGNTYGNEREVTICITDDDGNPLNNDTAAAVAAYLQALREVNFVVNVVSPNYSTIYVAVTVNATAGYSTTTIQTNVQSALLNYLTPANFGLPVGALSGWTNSQVIYGSLLLSTIQNALGVTSVPQGTLVFDVNPVPTNQSDLTLAGAFPLPVTTTASIPLSNITVITS